MELLISGWFINALSEPHPLLALVGVIINNLDWGLLLRDLEVGAELYSIKPLVFR